MPKKRKDNKNLLIVWIVLALLIGFAMGNSLGSNKDVRLSAPPCDVTAGNSQCQAGCQEYIDAQDDSDQCYRGLQEMQQLPTRFVLWFTGANPRNNCGNENTALSGAGLWYNENC